MESVPMYLSKEDLLKFKNHFLTEKMMILENQKTTQKMLSEKTEALSDEIDLITLEQQNSFDLRMQSRTDQFLKKIEAALSRIHNGTFGICDDCSSSIGIKRLQARPTSTLCFDCKEAQEKNETLFNGVKKTHKLRAL